MGVDDLMKDPFFVKFVKATASMLGEWYQTKAKTMSNDELYEAADFFPLYNPERDYSDKSAGYVCRKFDGTMMRLTKDVSVAGSDGVGLLSSSVPTDSIKWQSCWSTKPSYAKDFVDSIDSPYAKNECCIYKGIVYRSLVDHNSQSPVDIPGNWEKVGV